MMIQVLLKTTDNAAIQIWAADSLKLGDRVRWNGASWFVSAVYGTGFYRGRMSAAPEARKREKPQEGPLERYS